MSKLNWFAQFLTSLNIKLKFFSDIDLCFFNISNKSECICWCTVCKLVLTACYLFTIGSNIFEYLAIIFKHTINPIVDVAHESW